MKTNQVNSQEKSNLDFQKVILLVGIFLFALKILAWYLTGSVAIYSDAMESIVNVASAFLGLYSLYLTTKPKDFNHPYGHGKIEFLSSALEGVMIAIAGVIIIVEAVKSLFEAHTPHQMDYGIVLVAFTALCNLALGYFALKKGKKTQSLVLKSSGKHLITDTYSTIGIIIGLVCIYLTEIAWLDSAVAIVFSAVILKTAYSIIKESISGMMDEADEALIKEIVTFLQEKRLTNWVDLHNLRIIKYGSKLHMDVHLTLPYYLTVKEAHHEVETLDKLVNAYFGDRVELFVHADPCEIFSCNICQKPDCAVRKSEFKQQIPWNVENVSNNNKHRIGL